MVFWHDKGWRIYTEVKNYIRSRLRKHGYQEVNTPEVVDIRLWEKSGHAEKFIDDMFMTESENRNVRDQADELPLPRADLQPGLGQLPRPADAAGGIRFLPPQRALGRAAWPDARARLHPGRCAHLLHAWAGAGGIGRLHRVALLDLRGLRFRRGAGQAVHASGQSHRRRRSVGPGRSSPGGRAGRGRHRVARKARARAPFMARRSSSR